MLTLAVAVGALAAFGVGEVFLLLQLGAWLGPLPTLLLLLLTGAGGAWVAKRQGAGVFRTLREDLRSGMPPGDRLAEAALVGAGGLLLVVPGILSDAIGLVLLFPPSRRWLAPRLVRRLGAVFGVAVTTGAGRVPGGPTATPAHPFSSKFDDLP